MTFNFNSLLATGLTVVEQAFEQLQYARMQSRSGVELDIKDGTWLLTRDGLMRLRQDAQAWLMFETEGPDIREFMGLPVRVTHDDPEGTPMIMLVMEPMMYKRPP